MELHLSREMQERRIFPAYDIMQSSTRREEMLLGPDILQRVWTLRRMVVQMTQPPSNDDIASATEALLNQMRHTDSNEQFLEELTRF
jgi:transcription termination factor Rho